jgi:hypothetical protein
MEILIVADSIGRKKIADIDSAEFGDIVKAVVDVEQCIMAIGGELHADEEAMLSERCDSKRENVWGINLYPKLPPGAEWVEFDSMINLKPALDNRSRGVENEEIRKKIIAVVNKLIHNG